MLSVTRSSLPKWEAFPIFVYMNAKRMHVYRFFNPLTQHDVAVLLCEWAISTYGIFFFFALLAETLHQRASRSQLPRLDVHQTQQIKNGTDQCQNTINHSSSVMILTQTWACLLSQTFNRLMEKVYICEIASLRGFVDTDPHSPHQLFVFPISVNHLHCQQLIPRKKEKKYSVWKCLI